MGSRYEIPKLTEQEWASLPPLVAKGEDRAAKLAKIVEKWCTPIPKYPTDDEEYESRFIERFALIDGNTGEPIDFGGLLRMVEERLRGEGAPEKFEPRMDLFIGLRNCRIDMCNAAGCLVRPRLNCQGCRFPNKTNFTAATFGFRTSFDSTKFGNYTNFKRGRFGDEATFDSAAFGDWTSFASSTFGNRTYFTSATFGGETNFYKATFCGWTRFTSASFGSLVSFRSSTFGDLNSFDLATFGTNTSFEGARLGNYTSFNSATFGEGTFFTSATFGDRANFESARFGGALRLDSVRFGSAGGIGKALVRTAPRIGKVVGHTALGLRATRIARWSEWFHRKVDEGFSWNTVGALGRMPVLTRVSYLALVLVPIVAGVWPAVRGTTRWAEGVADEAATVIREERVKISQFEQSMDNEKVQSAIKLFGEAAERVEKHADDLAAKTNEVAEHTKHMPLGWVLAFFAALSVSLGHLVYYLFADERVREATLQAFREQRNNEFAAADKHLRRDRLRRAFPQLKDIAKLLPYSRHPHLVSRNSEAVWIPDDLEALEQVAERRFETEGAPSPGEPASPTATKETSANSQSEPVASDVVTAPPVPAKPNPVREIPHNRSELSQIIIDEGARAEYDVAARVNMEWATVSGVLYLVATLLILCLIRLQAIVVLRAAGLNQWIPLVNLVWYLLMIVFIGFVLMLLLWKLYPVFKKWFVNRRLRKTA